jgi:hypothetical protein
MGRRKNNNNLDNQTDESTHRQWLAEEQKNRGSRNRANRQSNRNNLQNSNK